MENKAFTVIKCFITFHLLFSNYESIKNQFLKMITINDVYYVLKIKKFFTKTPGSLL